MNLWNRLCQSYRDKSITAKFGLGIGFLLSLIVMVAATGYLSMEFVRRAQESIRTSWEIRHLVLEMDRGMEKARRLHGDFFLQYPQIGLAKAHEQYAQPSVREIAQVITVSNKLKNLIARSKVSEALRRRHVDLNLYLSSAKRFADTSIQSVELVTELAAPERGLEAQLESHLAALQAELEGTGILERRYRQMKSFAQDYRITRKRFLMQSAFNEAFSLRQEIARAPGFDTLQRERVNSLLDQCIAVAEKILDTDVAITSKFKDFALQGEAADTVSSALAKVAKEEVVQARARIIHAHSRAMIAMAVITMAGLLVAASIAIILNNSITRRVVRLTASAAELKKGHLDVFACDEGRDELSLLAGTFNVMAARIKELIDNLEQQVDQATEALRNSEERLRLAQDAANVGAWEWDLLTNEMFWSGELWKLYGLEPHSFKPSYEMWVQHVHPDDRSEAERTMREAALQGTRLNGEWRVSASNGMERWLMARGQPVRDVNSQSIRYLGIVLDITERKKMEGVLTESRQQMMDIINFLPDATLVIDKEGAVIAWNRAIEEMTGILAEDILGKGNYEYALPFYGQRRPILIDLVLQPQEQFDSKYARIESRDGVLIGEAYMPALKGGEMYLYATAGVLRDPQGNIVGAIESIRDITERRRADEERGKLEERLQRAEKMEALGTLAGGVAHDLNNVLGIVVGYSEMLLDDLEKSSPERSQAMEILKGGQRAAAIVQDLLTLARRGVPSRKILNLNNMLLDCQRSPEFEKLCSFHPQVRIKTDFEPDLLNIAGSSVHMEKSFMNLVSNAAEAMADGGVLTIKTRNQYLDQPVFGYDEVKEGDYVVLSVSDEGEGIRPSDLKRIFEPFYTKKVMGRSGTGLGLAVVWGAVKDHHGYVNVESEEGKGTTFTLYFPVTREEITREQIATSASEYLGEGESILVVDDVKEQRDLAVAMLSKLNYQATSVSSGEEALEYLKQRNFDLAILDMIMDPGMDGLDTYARILEIRPDQKAIIVSGFAETERVAKAQSLGAGAYVKKPYVSEKLGLAVRRELDRTE